MDSFLSILTQMTWPFLAIFGLIVSGVARRKHSGEGTTLMVVGSGISVLTSIANTLVSFGLQFDWFDFTAIGASFAVMSVLGLIG